MPASLIKDELDGDVDGRGGALVLAVVAVVVRLAALIIRHARYAGNYHNSRNKKTYYFRNKQKFRRLTPPVPAVFLRYRVWNGNFSNRCFPSQMSEEKLLQRSHEALDCAYSIEP